jgi:hypothetical protein
LHKICDGDGVEDAGGLLNMGEQENGNVGKKKG